MRGTSRPQNLKFSWCCHQTFSKKALLAMTGRTKGVTHLLSLLPSRQPTCAQAHAQNQQQRHEGAAERFLTRRQIEIPVNYPRYSNFPLKIRRFIAALQNSDQSRLAKSLASEILR